MYVQKLSSRFLSLSLSRSEQHEDAFDQSSGERSAEQSTYPRSSNYSRNARAAISISLAHFSLMLMGVLLKRVREGRSPFLFVEASLNAAPSVSRVLGCLLCSPPRRKTVPRPSFLSSFRLRRRGGRATVSSAHDATPRPLADTKVGCSRCRKSCGKKCLYRKLSSILC